MRKPGQASSLGSHRRLWRQGLHFQRTFWFNGSCFPHACGALVARIAIVSHSSQCPIMESRFLSTPSESKLPASHHTLGTAMKIPFPIMHLDQRLRFRFPVSLGLVGNWGPGPFYSRPPPPSFEAHVDYISYIALVPAVPDKLWLCPRGLWEL